MGLRSSIGDLEHLKQELFQQRSREAVPLVFAVDGRSSQEHRRPDRDAFSRVVNTAARVRQIAASRLVPLPPSSRGLTWRS